MATKAKKKYEEITEEELTKRYMRNHAIDRATGYGARTTENHVALVLLNILTGNIKIKTGSINTFLIPQWSEFSEETLSRKEQEIKQTES